MVCGPANGPQRSPRSLASQSSGTYSSPLTSINVPGTLRPSRSLYWHVLFAMSELCPIYDRIRPRARPFPSTDVLFTGTGTSSPVTTHHGRRICILVWHILFIYVRQSLPMASSTKSTSTYLCQTFHFCPSTLHPGHPPLSIHPVHQSTPPEPILFIHFLDNLARRVRSSDFSQASNQHTPYRSPRPVLVPSRPSTKSTLDAFSTF
jgi:hypothetical protein